MSRFLVTNATGYISLHIIDQLLKAGHFVRGTLRDIKDQKRIKPFFKYDQIGINQLELVQADLLEPETWNQAVQNIDIIIHLANPSPIDRHGDEQGLIEPSVSGTLNILNAALKSSVKRVIINSLAFTMFDPLLNNIINDDNDWDEEDKARLAFEKSRFLPEQAVWNLVEERKRKNLPCFELVVINPACVLGPLLSSTVSATVAIFLNLLNNQNGVIPDTYVLICDVRDVARANIKAAFSPYAVGNRHLITSITEAITLKEIAKILKDEFEPKGFKISTDADQISEKEKDGFTVDDTLMRNVLGIEPIDFKQTIIETAYSLIEQNLVQPFEPKKSFKFKYFNKKR